MTDRLLDLLGASSEREALVNLLAEREAMVELQADLEAMKIVKRRLIVVVELSRRACLLLEGDGAMFLPVKVRDLISKVLEQCKQLEDYVVFSRSLK